MPATGGDLLLHVKSDGRDLCFEMGFKCVLLVAHKFRFYHQLPKSAIKRIEETYGFSYQEADFGSDLTGFEDGPGNPKTHEEWKEAALISDSDPFHKGGSYCVTQKWKHDLVRFNSFPQSEQELIFGRTKGVNSKKIRPKPENSHTTVTDIKENGVELKIVRQSTPFGGVLENGLFFIAFASSPSKFVKQLTRMVSKDRLFEFSTPLSGNFWFVPSQIVLAKL